MNFLNDDILCKIFGLSGLDTIIKLSSCWFYLKMLIRIIKKNSLWKIIVSSYLKKDVVEDDINWRLVMTKLNDNLYLTFNNDYCYDTARVSYKYINPYKIIYIKDTMWYKLAIDVRCTKLAKFIVDNSKLKCDINSIFYDLILKDDNELLKVIMYDRRVTPTALYNMMMLSLEHYKVNSIYTLTLHSLFLPDNNMFIYAVKEGATYGVKLLMEYRNIKVSRDNNFALKLACDRGYTEIVKMFLNSECVSVDKEVCDIVYKRGYVYILKLLKNTNSLCVPIKYNLYTHNEFLYACQRGHIDIVIQHLKSSSSVPNADDNMPLKLSKMYGYEEIYKYISGDWRVLLSK